MIEKKQLKKEMTPKKVVTEFEAKRLEDEINSNKTGSKTIRTLVGKSIFPKRKAKW